MIINFQQIVDKNNNIHNSGAQEIRFNIDKYRKTDFLVKPIKK